MPSPWRFVLFLIVALSIWTAMNAYVLWRAWPFFAAAGLRWPLMGLAVLLWASFPLGRIAAHAGAGGLGKALEVIGSIWIGVLFLSLVCLLAADLATGFGFLLPRWAKAARLLAFGAAGLLSLVGLVQGLRPPVVQNEDVRLAGLPPALDGSVLVLLSDLHLGIIHNRAWLEKRVVQTMALHPDLIVIAGDLVDGDAGAVEPWAPVLGGFHAPLGVWACTGNHEFYAGVDRCVSLMEKGGMTVLRQKSQQAAEGLVIAGIDDLSARRQFRQKGDPHQEALRDRPPGATILLSHSPLRAEEAARLGVGLMLSGHTHGGQIWPFNAIVRIFYPRITGRYNVNGMTLDVCRGTGTWGPPMRLWAPGEIVRITLRSATSIQGK